MSKPFGIEDIPDSVWKRQFDSTAKSPLGWQLSARQLKRAADIVRAVSDNAAEEQVKRILQEVADGTLRDGSRAMSEQEVALMLDSSLIGVYLMLIGLAIENLAKGVLVARDPDCINVKGEFKHKGHNLLALIESCKICISPGERDMLRNLTEHTMWRGRYMIPLKASGLHPRRRASDERWVQPGRGGHNRDELSVIESLYGRLLKLIETERASRRKLDSGSM